MRINVKNEEKLTAAIKAAEGRATARTISAAGIRHVLEMIRVPKSKLHGTRVYYDGAEKFSSAYKYTPESTHFEAENVNGKWYVTAVYRDRCPDRSGYSMRVEYGKDAIAWIIDHESKIVVR